MLLGLLVGAVLVAAVVTTANAGALRGSDPAGNALAGAFYAIGLAVTWTLIAAMLAVAVTRPTPLNSRAARLNAALAITFVLAAASQAAAASLLLDGHWEAGPRTAIPATTLLLVVASILHALWRGFGLGIPAAWGVWGALAIAIGASALPWLLPRESVARPSSGLNEIVHPGLLLCGSPPPHILRNAAELARPADSPRGAEFRLIPCQPDGAAGNAV